MNQQMINELVEEYLKKTDRECLNCKEELTNYQLNGKLIIFECNKCGMKVSLEAK